ncbi:MAG: hypothetical protein JXM73_24350 [Anaerolineae bacterium]|nr:hypothetical protein [Anaerolineae bacterium]
MKRHLALVFVLCLVVGCSGGATSVPAATETQGPPPTQIPTETPSASPTPECGGDQLTAFLDNLAGLLERWDDAQSRAKSTPRISLSPAIGELQEIKRETAALDGPPCSEEVRALMVAYMEQVIKAFNLFMSGQWSDGQIDAQFKVAEDLLEDAVQAWDALVLKAGDGG